MLRAATNLLFRRQAQYRKSSVVCPFSTGAHTWGLGFLGTLGHGSSLADVPRPQPVASLAGVPLVAADSGWGHTAFLASDGSVVVLGRPCDFKNTLRHINLRSTVPALQHLMMRLASLLFSNDVAPARLSPPPDDPWVHVVCSPGGGTALLSRAGALHTFGSNAYGQCGLGLVSPTQHDPARVLRGWARGAGERVACVSLGFDHALAVTRSGAAYAWGRGDRGQLGCGDTGHYNAPVLLLGGPGHAWWDTRIVAVEAGMSVSAAIDASGGLWVWGKLQSLERGVERGGTWVMQDQLVPRRVAFPGDEEGGAGEGGSEGGGEGSSKGRSEGGAAAEDAEALLAARSVPVPGHPDALVVRADTLPRECTIAPWREEWREEGWWGSTRPREEGALAGGGEGEGSRGSGAAAPLVGAAGASRVRSRVAAVSAGVAHIGVLTEDGRLWMLGMRGRGVAFDASARSDDDGGAAALPDAHMQTTPLAVHPGPLAGVGVVGLRSSLHHCYALAGDGRVFRWGWRGRVEQWDPAQLLREPSGGAFTAAGAPPAAEGGASTPLEGVRELNFGYAHAVSLQA